MYYSATIGVSDAIVAIETVKVAVPLVVTAPDTVAVVDEPVVDSGIKVFS